MILGVDPITLAGVVAIPILPSLLLLLAALPALRESGRRWEATPEPARASR